MVGEKDVRLKEMQGISESLVIVPPKCPGVKVGVSWNSNGISNMRSPRPSHDYRQRDKGQQYQKFIAHPAKRVESVASHRRYHLSNIHVESRGRRTIVSKPADLFAHQIALQYVFACRGHYKFGVKFDPIAGQNLSPITGRQVITEIIKIEHGPRLIEKLNT